MSTIVQIVFSSQLHATFFFTPYRLPCTCLIIEYIGGKPSTPGAFRDPIEKIALLISSLLAIEPKEKRSQSTEG
ncbi:hypothetical protein RIF29_38132 [Crotalaria pallida]|uniref:Uncharacterized protein n=1 Tax=Crotalaria pallida TaxID=3830 RepID=A0AAN9DZ24_CROPI